MKKNRKRKHTDIVTFVADYLSEEWAQLLATAEDRDDLESTHGEWRQTFKKTCDELKAAGVECRPVLLRMNEFLAWCARNGRANNASSRVDYVIEKGRGGHAGIASGSKAE